MLILNQKDVIHKYRDRDKTKTKTKTNSEKAIRLPHLIPDRRLLLLNVILSFVKLIENSANLSRFNILLGKIGDLHNTMITHTVFAYIHNTPLTRTHTLYCTLFCDACKFTKYERQYSDDVVNVYSVLYERIAKTKFCAPF